MLVALLHDSHPTLQFQNLGLSPSKPHSQPPVDHHGTQISNVAILQISHSPSDDDDSHLFVPTLRKTAQRDKWTLGLPDSREPTCVKPGIFDGKIQS